MSPSWLKTPKLLNNLCKFIFFNVQVFAHHSLVIFLCLDHHEKSLWIYMIAKVS